MSASTTVTETTEGIEEITGTGTEATVEPTSTEAGEEAVLNDLHTPVSKPGTSTSTSTSTGEAGDEAAEETGAEAGEASEYEAGWVETTAQESSAETEATVDASQGSGQQEFFGFILPLLAPLAKALLPQLAGAAVKAGSGALQNLITQRTRRLQLRLAGRRESGEEGTPSEEAIARLRRWLPQSPLRI